ncbi:hypothetical protein THAOC_22070, partial [Thalassiosira oceanica]
AAVRRSWRLARGGGVGGGTCGRGTSGSAADGAGAADPGPLVYDGVCICVVAVGCLGRRGLAHSLARGAVRDWRRGGGGGTGWARAGGAVREGAPKKGSQKSARAWPGGREIKAPPHCQADRERARAKRWRSEGKGVTNFLGVHTDERARNGDVGKNSSSSERGGEAGRKTSLGNERGTTSEFREGRPYDGEGGHRQWKSAGLARGCVGGGGTRVARDIWQGSRRGRWLVCVWFVQLSLGGSGGCAEVGWTGGRGVGGGMCGRGTSGSPADGAAGRGLRRRRLSAHRLSRLSFARSGGGARLARGGGWGHGWARAGGAVREGEPKKGSQKPARAVSSFIHHHPEKDSILAEKRVRQALI